MVRLIAVSALLLAGATAALPAQPMSTATQIVRWSPFDDTGAVKGTLRVHRIGTGRCVDTYTTAGDIAYRCGRGNGVYFPCWRDGPKPTDLVLCAGDPWATSVVMMRSPGLLLYPGVTYLDDAYSPWAVELATGERCSLFQGAHDGVHKSRRTYVVDYYCEHSRLVLLRTLRRGRVWHIRAARYVNLRVGYELLGDRVIRRAFFGGLPPQLERQRKLAAQAVATARAVVRRAHPNAHLDLTWVRLTLPDAEWAYVVFSSVEGKGWFALLHRAHARWSDASAHKPFCTKLPPAVRRQLFLRRNQWNPPPDWSQGPPGEQRC